MTWIRPAQPTDAGKIGDVMHQFAIRTDWMPELYTGAQCIAFCGDMIDRGWVTVAGREDVAEGFIAQDGEEICAFFISTEVRSRGLGRMLLNHAKKQSDRLTLWTFEPNERAHKFYLRQGFVETHRTDGSGNDENLPEIHYLWTKENADEPRSGPDRSGK